MTKAQCVLGAKVKCNFSGQVGVVEHIRSNGEVLVRYESKVYPGWIANFATRAKWLTVAG